MKKLRFQLITLVVVLILSSCAANKHSCGAYNRGGGRNGSGHIELRN